MVVNLLALISESNGVFMWHLYGMFRLLPIGLLQDFILCLECLKQTNNYSP